MHAVETTMSCFSGQLTAAEGAEGTVQEIQSEAEDQRLTQAFVIKFSFLGSFSLPHLTAGVIKLLS